MRAVAKLTQQGIPRDDLIQEGSLGLIRAAQSFSPATHAVRFATYASFWIRAAILRAVVTNGPLIQVPERLFHLRRRCKRAIEDLESVRASGSDETSGPPANIYEIAAQSKTPPKHLQREVSTPASHALHELVGELVWSNGRSPDQELATEEDTALLHRALRRLSPFEAWVIRERFGLSLPPTRSVSQPLLEQTTRGDRKTTSAMRATCVASPPRSFFRRSYAELSRDCGLTAHRVRQAEQAALGELRTFLGVRLAELVFD